MEEISLHGNILGSYNKHDSDPRLGGWDYESGSLKLFSPDSTLSILLTSASSCGGDGKTLISKPKEVVSLLLNIL